MPLLGISSKILLSVVASLVGTGVIAGAVVATRNNNVNTIEKVTQNNDQVEKPLLPYPSEEMERVEVEIISKGPLTEIIEGSKEQISTQEKLNVKQESTEISEQPSNSEISLTQNSGETNIQSKNSLDNDKKIVSPSSQEEAKRTSSRKGRKNREQEPILSNEEKWEKEITSQQISLESIYKFSVGSTSENEWRKGCVLFRKEEKPSEDEEELDIMEGRVVEGSFDSCGWQTFWSLNKSEGENRTGFWVRGKVELVNQLINNDSNWDTLKSVSFVKVNGNKQGVEGLNTDLCNVDKKRSDSWVEVGCVAKES
ncbi:hypothetical protein MSUIS_00370 [Mycoplasma suis KI3806]|uniref:Uncharacterized protein n=1 Tax=Mycoplasma suis (strain KI_3806) TaxID=708248 RepID=F0V2Q8_MYCS3|nr:hypothetical protein [Mycoplasma suis]CBZ40130.1 hypothetical protein MSUIS_00370 [Mycoplasma suis KI3806]